MPIPTPFHSRIAELNTSLLWKDWAGYHAVRSFDVCHEREYYAFRHTAGMIDVTPLFKYDVTGRDAGAFLSRLMVREISKLKPNRATYLCWCDDDGKVIDDGTVARLDETHFRVTSTNPNMHWFVRHARGWDVRIEDVSRRIAALSVQGPTARKVLQSACDAEMDGLGFFRLTRATFEGGIDAIVSRTGYTGDLGYEIWVDNTDAVKLWDALIAAGRPHGLQPAGLDAMDVTRIEAGFILNGVDYFSALHSLIDSRKSSPYELALGWTVQLERERFIGQAALRREKLAGPPRLFVGLDVDWEEFEGLFAKHGLPPELPAGGWRDGVPVFDSGGKFIGQATSGAWSPLLKQNIALATVRADQGEIGNRVRFEVTVEYRRHTVEARVVRKPFFDPERKRA